jgi:hypothetical protein
MSNKTPNLPRDSDGKLSSWAWPGGYPIYYITKDSGVLCPKCANDNSNRTIDGDDDDCPDDAQWLIVAAEVNWEDGDMTCDNCAKRIESAYTEKEEPNEIETT